MAKKAGRKAVKKTAGKPTRAAPKKRVKKAAGGPAPRPRAVNVVAMASELETANTVNLTGGAPVGACLISFPGSPHVDCRQYTQAQCNAVGGTWIGGPCR